MKRKQIIFSALAILAVCGCETEEKLLSNRLFFDADTYKNEVRVAIDEGVTELSRNMAVAIASPVGHDIGVSFCASPELLDTYREAYYDYTAELLPESHYDLDGLNTVIKAGDISGDIVTLNFKNLGEGQGLDYSKSYVLPVSLNSNEIDALPRAKTMYFVIKEASLVNYAADMYSNCAWPEWGGFGKVQNLETFTMEALINCHAFNNSSSIETIMGVEDHFLIRIGDVTIPTNQIQIACAYKDIEGNSTIRGDVTSDALQIKKDRWYHIAVTFERGVIKAYLDGRLRAEGDLSIIGTGTGGNEISFTSVDFSAPHSDEMDNKPRCFWIGYSYDSDRSLDGMIAEARVWNRALTEAEINAPGHFYKVYPGSDGRFDDSLIAYWKFDEGTGSTVKDHSIYGNDLTADHEFVWYPVELPAKEN